MTAERREDLLAVRKYLREQYNVSIAMIRTAKEVRDSDAEYARGAREMCRCALVHVETMLGTPDPQNTAVEGLDLEA